MHQMAGIDVDKIRETYGVPDDYEPVTGIALGYPGDPASLPDALEERERGERVRRPGREAGFSGSWGKTPDWA